MFVAQMAFFARVSDPRIGGTYMTLLNTIANLGSLAPSHFLVFHIGDSEKQNQTMPNVDALGSGG